MAKKAKRKYKEDMKEYRMERIKESQSLDYALFIYKFLIQGSVKE